MLALLAISACTEPNADAPATLTPVIATSPTTAAEARDANSLPACPDGPFFDHLPLGLEDFRALRPLGFTSVPIHIMPARFSSFSRELPGEDRPPAPVYFPGEAWVTQVLTTDFPSTGARGYQLQFSPCKDTKFQFNHIGALSPKLEAAIAAATLTNCREFDSGQGQIAKTCQANVFVNVSTGEQAGMSDEFAGVDFVAIDYRLPPAGFANPASYTRDFFYYTSPVGYFTPALQEQLKSKLGSYDGRNPRTAAPVEGVYMQDVAGTAQGNWFLAGQTPALSPSSDGTLALVHEYVDPGQPLLVVGTGVPGLRSGQYSFVPSAEGVINRDWPAVTPDGRVYCYEAWRSGQTAGGLPLATASGVVLIAMPAPDRLRVEFVPGVASCPPMRALSDRTVEYRR